MIRGAHLLEGFGVIDGYLEGDLQSRMAKYGQIVSQ
jgi:hypothetical protein